MKANELWMRCLKARLVSWLNTDKVGATIPLGNGQYVVFAIYENGRYYQPDPITIPDGVPPGWGLDQPDGPAVYNRPKDDEDDEDDEDEDDDE